MALRANEVGHRDVNHGLANELSQGRPTKSGSRQD